MKNHHYVLPLHWAGGSPKHGWSGWFPVHGYFKDSIEIFGQYNRTFTVVRLVLNAYAHWLSCPITELLNLSFFFFF